MASTCRNTDQYQFKVGKKIITSKINQAMITEIKIYKKIVQKYEAYTKWLKTKPSKNNTCHVIYDMQLASLRQQLAECKEREHEKELFDLEHSIICPVRYKSTINRPDFFESKLKDKTE